MQPNLWINYAISIWLVTPLLLLAVAWRSNKREKLTFVLLLVSAALLLSATVRDIK